MACGPIGKMQTEQGAPVKYRLPIGEERVDMNALVGEMVQLRFLGELVCVGCGQRTNKSYNQGFCYPCFKSLACNDLSARHPDRVEAMREKLRVEQARRNRAQKSARPPQAPPALGTGELERLRALGYLGE